MIDVTGFFCPDFSSSASVSACYLASMWLVLAARLFTIEKRARGLGAVDDGVLPLGGIIAGKALDHFHAEC
ncbi:hypothetical protein [Shewanella sp. YIC-542]|uniref:hypothetical protein n=1 Tax=Shewanella mytili TaxID=3377111 RepID=UPI00398ED542